jgi:hypothetical protein
MDACRFYDLFQGRENCYAVQQPDGSYMPVRRALTIDVIQRHLAGEITVAIYPLRSDGKIKLAALDFDDLALKAQVLFIRNWLKRFLIPSFIEFSGQKGYHLWLFFEDWIEAKVVRAVLAKAVEKMVEQIGCFKPVEIFPKQDAAEKFGSLIKLPLGKHQKSQKFSYFCDDDFNACEPRLELISLEQFMECYQEEVEEQEKREQPQGGAPCVAKILATSFKEHEGRDVVAFRLACHFYKAGIPREIALQTLLEWDARNIDRLGEKTIAKKVEQGYSGKYGRGCFDVYMRRFCQNSCPLQKKLEKDTESPPTSEDAGMILVASRQLSDITSEVLSVLYAANKNKPTVFQRGNMLVRILEDQGMAYIDALDEHALRGILARVARFYKPGAGGALIDVPPPLVIVRDILSLKDWQFPHLLGITTSPVVRPDGSILQVPGYDPGSRLFYCQTEKGPAVPENPTDQDVQDAINLIKETLWNFPFDSEASRANAVAALLTPVLRPLIGGLVPMGIIDKPQPGTGASLLCETISLVATGRPSGTLRPYVDDDEWRKAITTILMRGHQVIVIDNADTVLASPSLASLLTSHLWRDRWLGRNTEIVLPNTTCWFANGNNIQLKGDLPRRCYFIRLDSGQAQPWLRPPDTFLHANQIAWVKENRGKILSAILVIARAWILAGRPVPPDNPSLGTFERWCETLGGILNFIGIKGFLTNLQEMYSKSDIETPQWEQFLQMWFSILGDKAVTTAEVVQTLRDYEQFRTNLPDSIANIEDKGFTRKLGIALARKEGVRFTSGLMLTKPKVQHGVAFWRVENTSGAVFRDYSFAAQSQPESDIDRFLKEFE